MMIYRNPRTNQVQEIGEWEKVRRFLLEAAGWVAEDNGVAENPAEAPPEGVTVRIDDDLVVLAPGEKPTSAPGFRLVETTSNDSDMQEFISAPVVDAPKRKRGK